VYGNFGPSSSYPAQPSSSPSANAQPPSSRGLDMLSGLGKRDQSLEIERAKLRDHDSQALEEVRRAAAQSPNR
jgi:hypothetical protein